MKKHCALSKGVRKVLTPDFQADHRLFAPLFCALTLIALWEQPTALPTAGQETDSIQEFDLTRPSPLLRFAGTQGGKPRRPSAAVSPLTSSGTVPVRQCESSAHPDPSRRDHRTHAGNPAAGCSAVSVHSCPSWQGDHHPMLYHTDLTTNQYRDSRRQAIVHRSPNPVISRNRTIAAG